MRLTPNNPALAKAWTIHPKAIKAPTEVDILKPVGNNGKMGKGDAIVTKGKWRGFPMFVMSLIERATCPSDCLRWANCYANNSFGLHRIDHTHPEFLPKLEAEIAAKAALHRHGFVLRPQVIGDFYSVEYAQFWADQAAKHKNLHLFGFTHRHRQSGIGQVLMKANESPRVWIRFSDQGGDMSANVEGEGIPCPEQTGKTKSCLTCSLCWSTTKAVSFKEH